MSTVPTTEWEPTVSLTSYVDKGASLGPAIILMSCRSTVGKVLKREVRAALLD